MMVAAFFFGTEIAQAADISFSGKIRTRYENTDKGAFDVRTEDADFTATQVRLNAKANINESTSAFVQMQSSRIWGTANAALTASDGDASVGLHEAYFTLKNFAGTGWNAKVGRQQIVLDGHRLYGHTGWTTGAQTHDGLRMTHSHDNMTINYGLSMVSENGAADGITENDVISHFLHTNFQGVLGGALSTIVTFSDDDCGLTQGTTCANNEIDNQWFTIGARQAGKMFGLDYRAEYYFQTGAAGGAAERVSQANIASTYGTAHTLAGYSDEATREAYMFGIRVGKAFKNVTWKPKVTLWYDYLSGNSDSDLNEGTWGQFDTMYDTGHKFYGFMDLFLNNTGAGVNFMGLQDLAIKVVLKPAPKWTLKADLHNFRLAESVGGNPSMSMRTGLIPAGTSNVINHGTQFGGRDGGNEIGSELDLTLVHGYNPNVKFVFGYSQFMAENLYHQIDASSVTSGYANQAHWMYVMADVKF